MLKRKQFIVALLFTILLGICPASFADLVTYSYDDFGRLTAMSYSDGVTVSNASYSLDHVSNFTNQSLVKQAANTTADSDGDGIPDWWEIANGLNPNNPNDAALDADQDGHSNLQEYAGGSNPHDASSQPNATAVPAFDTFGILLAIAALLTFLLRTRPVFPRSALAMTILCLGLSVGSAHATAGPGWIDQQGTPVTPQEADAYYRAKAAASNGITLESATTITPEITALARSLKNDPKLIYEYVRNHVEYVPYYGSLKGATLTWLEGSGNDFDQASLMISLLRASGYTAQYVYGQMTIPAYSGTASKDMQHWLSVDANTTVISNILTNGNIPYTLSGSNYTVSRVWVQATIAGSTYLFDPAFKPSTTISGIDLKTAMGYSKSNLLAAVGGTVGTDYVQNLSESGLHTLLNSYTQNLAAFIRANHPTASTEQIVGSRTISPQYLTALPTSLDFSATPQYYWTDIPDTYIHKVRIKHGEIDQTLNIPDLAGQKLSIVYKAGTITSASETPVGPMPIDSLTVTPAESTEITLPNIPATVPSVDGDPNGVILPMGTYSADFGRIAPPSVGSSYSQISFGPMTNNNSVIVQVVVTLTSNPSGAYSIVSGAGTTNLFPGSSLSTVVKFSNTSQTTGTKTGQLRIQWFYNGTPISGGDNYYNLTGIVTNAPNYTGSYGYNFGTPYLGNTVDGTVRLKNSGSLPLSITGVSLTGTDASRFSITGGNSAGSVAAGQYRDISVRYLANSVASHAANVQVSYTYDGLAYTLSLGLAGQTLSTPVAQLWLDDTKLAEETEPVIGTDLSTLTLSIDHPYTSSTFDQSVTHTLKRSSTYVIAYDFGSSRLGRTLEKRERQMQTYRESGLADNSRQVLTETLNVIGATWMRDTTMHDNMLGNLAGVLDLRHHRFGLIAQESGYYVDIKAQMLAVTSRHGDDTARIAYARARNHSMSAYEHGVLEQMQPGSPAVSTVKLLQINNANAKKTFKATSANFATIKTQLTNYSTQDLNTLQTSVNNGNTLILPADGQIPLLSWKGKGYIDYNENPYSMHFSMLIGGDYYGGYSAYKSPLTISPVSNLAKLNITPPAIIPKIGSTDPVDMVNGFWMYDNTDLSLSGGAGGLAFKRAYNSGSNTIKKNLGYGWSHNYQIFAEAHSSTPTGLGERQPLDAVAQLAASVATLDLMTGTPDLKAWVTSSLIGKWGMDAQINNVVGIHLGTDLLTFIKLPDGSFVAPPGTTSSLVLDGGSYRVDERFDRTIRFNSDKTISNITDADGNATSFSYNSGKLAGVADNFGHSLSFTYTGDLLTRVADSASRSITFGYTGNNLTSYTDLEGKVWNYTYDSSNRILTLKNPRSITTVTNVYDTLGRVQSQTMPRQTGNITYNLYFSGFRNIEEDGAGGQTIYYFDEKKRLLGTENQLGQRNYKTYDGQNHVIAETDPLGSSTSFTYDANHNVIEVTNHMGKKSLNSYDSQYRLTDVTDPLGNHVHTDYDTKHHPTAVTTYPVNGQSIITRKSYFANGLVNTSTDAKGIITTLTWDSNGNPATSKTSTAPAIVYAYDNIGRMLSLTDQASAKTSFSYDKRSLATGSTDPLSKNSSTSYYDDGTLWKVTDRNNKTTTFTYTNSGKVNNVTYQGGTQVSYTYDQQDNLTRMQDSSGSTTYSYDAANRLTSSTDPRGFGISYTRDAAGNITKITYPGNKTVSYGYDPLHRLTTVTIDWLGRTAVYNYDDAGRMTGLTQFNNTTVSYSYDNANRLTNLENRLSTPGTAIATYAFTLDANGNRISSIQTVPVRPDIPAATTAFTMNIQKNRLIQAGSTSFSYDNEGQLTTKTGETYSFDDAHRVTSISGTTSSQYSYDGAGNRIQATRNGITTRYIYDANGNLLAEADSSNSITRYYIYGDGLLATVTAANQLYCYHFDATGHTTALTDTTPAIVNKYAYTPYGAIVGQQETITQPFKYVGKYGVMAESNGLYYMKARYYDPSIGRFISEDPKGFEGGDVNLMGYVKNNPVMGVDPSGLWTLQIGLNGTGGGGVGGTAEGGFLIGHSSKSGWQFGSYQSIGGGGYGGASGSVGINLSFSRNNNINDLKGRSGIVGGSAGELVTVGGGYSVNEGSRPSYSLGIGLGGGPTPLEVHGMIANTWVQEWTNKKSSSPK